MQDKDKDEAAQLKPDLKHDNMEYSAATDGDDILDQDKESAQQIEDEEITAEELALLEDDALDNQAEALNTAETDSQADEDNYLAAEGEEDELGDIAEEATENDEEEEFRRS